MPAYWLALALTVAVETPAYASMLRRWVAVDTRRGLRAGVLVNLASHPLAFLVVMPRIAPVLGFVPALVAVEAGVWVLEAGSLSAWLRRDAEVVGLVALVANALSLSLGLTLVR